MLCLMFSLEYHAARWLWLEKRCQLVLHERSPRSWACGEPDVLGITKAGFLLEIEVKRSVADFRANAHKRCIQNRETYLKKMPKQFWFMVPPNLVEKVQPEVPQWAGLLTTANAGWGLRVVSPAESNSASQRLSIRECVKLMRLQTNQLMACQERNFGLLSRIMQHEPWNEDYAI